MGWMHTKLKIVSVNRNAIKHSTEIRYKSRRSQTTYSTKMNVSWYANSFVSSLSIQTDNAGCYQQLYPLQQLEWLTKEN